MSAQAAHSYAQRRLLELLGIERYVARPARAVARSRIAVVCARADAARHSKLVRHLAAALGLRAEDFGSAPASGQVICFGTVTYEGPATNAPSLDALRASPDAKRALWQSMRALRRGAAGR